MIASTAQAGTPQCMPTSLYTTTSWISRTFTGHFGATGIEWRSQFKQDVTDLQSPKVVT
jgi:hypothetical protein